MCEGGNRGWNEQPETKGCHGTRTEREGVEGILEPLSGAQLCLHLDFGL